MNSLRNNRGCIDNNTGVLIFFRLGLPGRVLYLYLVVVLEGYINFISL